MANLFHLKRFWIARIKTNDVKAAYFQLEHFPIIPIDASDEEKESAKKTIESALNEGKKDTTWWQKLAAIAGTDIKDLGPQLAKLVTGQKADLIEWANNNIAGHTQIRIQFNEPIELVEQVMKNGQLTPQVEKIRDIVLSSEAQGTVVQKGETPLGYDPIKAIQPLFFSVNKLVSLHEKYSDMVVRQRHWIEQFPLLLNLNNTPQSQNPSFEELMAKYIEMSKTNWNSMTQNDPQMIQPALYKTIDFKPPALNQTRNCTTEVITVLEANRPQKWLSFAKARWQDVTFQRAYPMLLGGALADFGLLNEKINFPGMDSDVQVEGEEKLKATDETLVDVRAHFKNLEVCEQYFGPADKAKCITWAQKIL